MIFCLSNEISINNNFQNIVYGYIIKFIFLNILGNFPSEEIRGNNFLILCISFIIKFY